MEPIKETESTKQSPPNMWDAESKSYSLMTLMEIDGTNKQLDFLGDKRDKS